MVEWYYQHQSDVGRRNAFLSKEIAIDLHYAVPGRMGAQSVSKFSVAVTVFTMILMFKIDLFISDDGRQTGPVAENQCYKRKEVQPN